jgi:hypothetical protein
MCYKYAGSAFDTTSIIFSSSQRSNHISLTLSHCAIISCIFKTRTMTATKLPLSSFDLGRRTSCYQRAWLLRKQFSPKFTLCPADVDVHKTDPALFAPADAGFEFGNLHQDPFYYEKCNPQDLSGEVLADITTQCQLLDGQQVGPG